MKNILLLSSVLCIFLSACGSATPIATLPPATPVPPATATGAPPATEAPTGIPTTIATAAPTEGPAKVETQVDKIPHDTFEHLNSPEFAQWVFDTEAKRGFPRNPGAVPLSSIDVSPDINKNFFNKYGFEPIFLISKEDAQVFLNDQNKVPWSLAAIREFEIDGIKLYYFLIRWENSELDGTKTQAGFTGQILVPIDQNLKDLKDDPGYLFSSQNRAPTGTHFDPSRIENSEYIKTRGIAGKVFVKWYKQNLGIFNNQTFWEQCESDSKIINKTNSIPLSAQGDTAY